jgi:hypothetical protein
MDWFFDEYGGGLPSGRIFARSKLNTDLHPTVQYKRVFLTRTWRAWLGARSAVVAAASGAVAPPGVAFPEDPSLIRFT